MSTLLDTLHDDALARRAMTDALADIAAEAASTEPVTVQHGYTIPTMTRAQRYSAARAVGVDARTALEFSLRGDLTAEAWAVADAQGWADSVWAVI